MEGHFEYRQVLNSTKMHLMRTTYVVPLSLKYEKMEEKKDCEMFPCEKKTKYRLVNFSEITFELNNGAGGSGTKMYLCYQCFQKHKNNVYEARKSGEKKVFYVFVKIGKK